MMVELNTKTLSLKQSFVRYVSHEIRSIALYFYYYYYYYYYYY